MKRAKIDADYALWWYGQMDALGWCNPDCIEEPTRRMRNRVRKLPPALRKFALALRRVVEDVPGPENLQGEKIMKALKIGHSRYYELRLEVEKNLV